MVREGGQKYLEAMPAADVARKWRLPEFVGLALLVAVVLLIEASIPTYEQFIPPVSFQKSVTPAADIKL